MTRNRRRDWLTGAHSHLHHCNDDPHIPSDYSYSILKMVSNLFRPKMNAIFIIFLVLLLAIECSSANLYKRQTTSNNIIQRSKEANCLIKLYHACLSKPMLSNISIAPNSTNANAPDCFRLSTGHNRTANLACGENECPWDGKCVQTGLYNENNGLHVVDDLPISTYYEDVHTITISFPRYSDTVTMYILETRPIVSRTQSPSPFRFAGVSNQTTIVYRVFNVCDRYEFRPTAILSNGSVITFLSKTSNSNPPDFTLDNVRLASLQFDAERNQAMAIFSWKNPYGYARVDVEKYETYLHTLQCDASSEDLNQMQTNDVEKMEEGGTISTTFPVSMIEGKCQFRLMVWAVNVCGNRTMTDAKIDFILNCSTVRGYSCPAAELRPYCFSHVNIAPLGISSATNGSLSVNILWTRTIQTRPQYYHVRWGLVRLVDLTSVSGRSSGGRSAGISEEHRSSAGSASTQSTFSIGIPGHTSASESGSASDEKSKPDFSVWMLQPETMLQAKVSGEINSTVLANLSVGINYGVQVCAIFNEDFKAPDWPKVTTVGFSCQCVDLACSVPSGLRCHQGATVYESRSTPTRTSTLPTIQPPLAMIRGVPQPPGEIDSVTDFRQTLVRQASDGIEIRLTWNPPKQLVPEQILRYDISVETLMPCTNTPICCDYVKLTKIKKSNNNATGNADLFLPTNVIYSHCEFMVKIITTAINGASSVSLKSIGFPTSPVPIHVGVTSQTNVSCDQLLCSHTCNSTNCLCPAGMTLGTDGRNCEGEEVARVDCRGQAGCLNSTCPDGFNRTTDGLDCVPHTASSNGVISKSNPGWSMFDYCDSFGCEYSCRPDGQCLCPRGMTLMAEGRTCRFQDPDVWNVTVGSPLAPLPSVLCASSQHAVFTFTSQSGHVHLDWNASVFDGFSPDSTVLVRIGPAIVHTVNFFTIYRLDGNATNESTSLASESIDMVPSASSTGFLGIQFCIYNSQLQRMGNDSLMNWDIVPVLVVPRDSRHSHKSNAVTESESDWDSKRTLVVALAVPLSCLVILVSLFALLCYFYSTPMIQLWTRQRSKWTRRRRQRRVDGEERRKRKVADPPPSVHV